MILRFDIHQRAQHLLLIISVSLLFLSGLPIKYDHMDWAKQVTRLFGGFGNLLRIHQFAALLLMGDALYHLGYLLYIFRHKGRRLSMLITLKDIRDVYHHLKYLIGKRPDPPQFGRYSYLEKLDYFMVAIGVLVMIASGLVLWFPERAGILLSNPGIELMRLIHSNEALVFLLIITIGHIFRIHLNPDFLPLNRTMYHGLISREHLQKYHPLEYQQLLENYQEGDGHDESLWPGDLQTKETKKSLSGQIVVIIELLFYLCVIGIAFLLLFTRLFS